MDSEAFSQELLAPVREFCRSLDDHQPTYSYIPLTTDEDRIRVRIVGRLSGESNFRIFSVRRTMIPHRQVVGGVQCFKNIVSTVLELG